jgi:hypothetical protein
VIYVPASEVAAIAAIAIETMKDPKRWSLGSMSTTSRGVPVSVWSKDAYVLSELGHVYKAAQKYYGLPEKIRHKQLSKVGAIASQIDAQVRYLSSKIIEGEVVYTSMVTHSFETGREGLILLFERAIERLKGGDDVLLSPFDVGVGYVPPAEELEESMLWLDAKPV